MPYIHFTDEQKLRANNVDLPEFLRRQGEKLIPSGRDKRLAADHSITVRGNQWFDHASEQGGGAISFVQNFYGLTYPEAVVRLLGGEQGVVYEPTKKLESEPKREFALPPANGDMRRVYAYLLQQRLIGREVLTAFAKAGLIYESREESRDHTKQYHNAIFVGFDAQGVPRHAHKRGLYTQGKSYRGNIEGCDPRFSFHHTGTSDRLYVFEAPIDLLSFITLHPLDWQKHSYVALCGTSEHAMLWMLEQNPEQKKVILCLDHDTAGIEATGRLTEILRGKGYDQVAPLRSVCKDWNADLKVRHGLPAEPAEEHPQLIAAAPVCKRIGAQCAESDGERAPRQIPALLQRYRNLLHWGRFDEAMDCMESAAGMALSAAQRELRQLGENAAAEQLADRLRESILPHQNRGALKNRPEEIAMELQSILAKSAAVGLRSEQEKRQLAGDWMNLARSCAKAVVRYEAEQLKQEQKEEQALRLAEPKLE